MFDREAYMKDYYAKRYKKRKAEGRCTACGEKLTTDCITLLCNFCREKQNQRCKIQWQKQKRSLWRKAKEMLEGKNED